MANQIYQKIINKNPSYFETGNRFTRRQFCKIFRIKDIVHEGEFADVHRSNLKLVGVQAEINNILRTSGLCLKSEKYYSRFYIASKKQTTSSILNHQRKSETHKICSDILERTMSTRIKDGTWGKYTPSVPQLSGSAKQQQSTAYKNKLKRIKNWTKIK